MPSAATWMDLESAMLSEMSQPGKEDYHEILYMWNLKRNDANELTKQRRTVLEKELKGTRVGQGGWG